MKKDETIKFNEVSSERHLDLNKLMQDVFVEEKKIVKKVVQKKANKKSTKK